MSSSPLSRVATLSGGLICAAGLIMYVGLGLSIARPETAALNGLPAPTQAHAHRLYWSVRLAPWNSSNYVRLGEFFLANNRPAPAIEWLRRATVWDASPWHAWYYLGLAEHASYRYAEAESAFRKVLALNPDYIAARFQLATLMLDRRQFGGAADVYATLLHGGADRTRVLQGLGSALFGMGKYPAAELAFTQVLARFPAYGDAHAGLAASLRATGDEQRAAHEARLAHNWRRMVPIRTDDPLVEEMEREFPTALSLVQEAVRNRDPRTGIEATEKALALDPKMNLAWENIISMYGQAHRPKDALRAWNKLATLDPNNVRGRFDLAAALTQAGDRSRAAALLEQILTLDPSYADAHRVLGVVAELDGKMEEAGGQFRTALESDPSLSEAHVDLGLILLRTGQAKQAQTELLRALLPPCENPERTLTRELSALRDPAVEQAYEQAVRAQAEEKKQYSLIAILNSRGRPRSQ
jgi:tetratricopeptide (TPR) repeat protein